MMSNAPTSVSVVRFADPYNGWAYGPGLWITHDGARTWHQLDVGGQVVSLEAGNGRVEAVVRSCSGCTGSVTRLLSSPVNRDLFALVASAPDDSSAPSQSGGALLTLHPPVGFAVLGQQAVSGKQRSNIVATSGGSWESFPDPCQVTARESSLSSFVAPDTTSLLSLCTAGGAAGSTSKSVVITRNGRTVVLGNPPLGGDGGLIAANGISTILVASRSGDDFLYRSTDSGRTWTTLQFHDGGIGLTDIGFTTTSQAVAIRGQASIAGNNNSPAELLMTTDAGATWHNVTF